VERTLHILKDPNPREALEIIEKQMELRPDDSSVLLIQEAVRMKPNFPVKLYVLEEDANSRGIVPGQGSINYTQMLEMILVNDSVVVW
jgi:sulfur transfer complex TusBCD TusB component (DsrH family)